MLVQMNNYYHLSYAAQLHNIFLVYFILFIQAFRKNENGIWNSHLVSMQKDFINHFICWKWESKSVEREGQLSREVMEALFQHCQLIHTLE